MNISSLILKIRNKILYKFIVDRRDKSNYKYALARQSLLIDKTFTIFSNNCWAGHVYRWFSIPYNTPTVGLYFYPDDYIRFLKDYKKYLAIDLSFISWEESQHALDLKRKGQTNVPIGRLGDVEIVFLHYTSEKEAYEKWNRRIERINWDHILVKCTKQNGMTESQIQEFDSLPIKNKFIFVEKVMPNVNSAIYYRDSIINDQVVDDIIFFNKYIDIPRWINQSFERV